MNKICLIGVFALFSTCSQAFTVYLIDSSGTHIGSENFIITPSDNSKRVQTRNVEDGPLQRLQFNFTDWEKSNIHVIITRGTNVFEYKPGDKVPESYIFNPIYYSEIQISVNKFDHS